MKTNQLQRKIGGAILSVSMLSGIGFAASATTLAQYRQDRRDDRDRDNQDRDHRDGDRRHDRDRGDYGNNYYRAAQNQGYQDGLNTGANDASQGKNSNPQRSHFYRSANSGYNSSYGNSGQYKQAYRDGFLRGYNEGYNRNSNNGRYNRRRDNDRRYPFSLQ